MAKIPAIPFPSTNNEALFNTVVALKQAVEILTGQTRDDTSKAVRWEEINTLKQALGIQSGVTIISNSLAPGSAVNLTSSTSANICTVTLTPGTWTLSASLVFVGNAATTVYHNRGCITTQSATFVTNYGDTNSISNVHNGVTIYASGTDADIIGPYVVAVDVPTNIYLVAYSLFGTNTNTAYGTLRAIRIG